MRIRIPTARICENAWSEALETLRSTMRAAAHNEDLRNPFARTMPCPIADQSRTAKILRVF